MNPLHLRQRRGLAQRRRPARAGLSDRPNRDYRTIKRCVFAELHGTMKDTPGAACAPQQRLIKGSGAAADPREDVATASKLRSLMLALPTRDRSPKWASYLPNPYASG